jgi:hypothetical protein
MAARSRYPDSQPPPPCRRRRRRRRPRPQELAHRYRSPATTPKRPGGDNNNNNHAAPASPSAAAAAAAMAGGSLARQGSIERSLDVGGLTASTVLAMYHHDDNECVLLSELQVGGGVGRVGGVGQGGRPWHGDATRARRAARPAALPFRC